MDKSPVDMTNEQREKVITHLMEQRKAKLLSKIGSQLLANSVLGSRVNPLVQVSPFDLTPQDDSNTILKNDFFALHDPISRS
jgi:hypothetical protein